MSIFCNNNCHRVNCSNGCNKNCNANCQQNCTTTCNPVCNPVCNTTCENVCTTTCEPVCNNNCSQSNENSTCTCTCTCTRPDNCCNGCVAAETTKPKPQKIRAMLQSVLDSCCTTENICREFTVNCPAIFNPDDLEIGSVIPVELDGDISFKEVNRNKDDCACISTVRFQIPIRLFGAEHCGCKSSSITRTITVIRSATLCCTRDSVVYTPNTKVLAISAVVTDIDCHHIRICVSILFQSCLQQTILREYTFEATPICEYPNCNDFLNVNVDNCDLTCGCLPSAKQCPSC